jgi:uncharacterized protein YjbJ (UPF0337 family)
MSLKDRAEAAAKNVEGKIQEGVGEVTGNPEDKIAGKAKQAEAKAKNTVENVKDKAKKLID